MAPSPPSSASSDGPRPKSVLICPTCGHESRVEGDWHERPCDTAGGPKLAIVCPECEAEITYRPIPRDPQHEHALSPTPQ